MQIQKLKYKKTKLGEIPEEWEIIKLGEISHPITKGTTPTTEGFTYVSEGINFFRIENINKNGDIDISKCYYITQENHNVFKRSQLKENDILFSLAGTLGRVAIVKGNMLPANINQALGIVRLKEKDFDTNFIAYFLRSSVIFKHVNMEKTIGAQPNISLTQLSNFIICEPPLKEQQKIASILSSVDGLIQKTDLIIEQTLRLKKGLMQRLLTKGIGHSKFKQTELGEIPEGWQLEKLSNICHKINDGTHFTPGYIVDGIPFLRITDIQRSQIDWNNAKKISLKEHQELIKRCKPEQGDILFSKNGTIGITKIVDWNRPFSIFVSLCLIKPIHEKLSNHYLKYILPSDVCFNQIRKRSKQGTITNLHLEEIREFLIPLPSLSEQQKIAFLLSNVDNLIQKLQDKKKNEETLKKGLMQQLLTGKVRVKV